jgi:hypothetical protein
MKRQIACLMMVICLALLSACEADRMSEKGFSLPPGDTAQGREAFVYLHCYECHKVAGEQFPIVSGNEAPFVELGGEVSKVKTYGELVTAVINPSHKLAAGYPVEDVSSGGISHMPVYNRFMTVQELIDIVMYLQPHYEVVVPEYVYRAYP